MTRTEANQIRKNIAMIKWVMLVSNDMSDETWLKYSNQLSDLESKLGV